MIDSQAYLNSKLNDEQYNAASFVTWNSLILAWAWSWKTRTLTYKIAHLIVWYDVKPDRILAVTFTNKAANEMKERLVDILEDLNSCYKARDFKRTWTFHSIFLKILKQDIEMLWKHYTSWFTVYDSSDSSSLLKKLIKETWMHDRLEYREASRYISWWKNKWWLPEQAWLHCSSQMEERASVVYTKYQAALEQSNALDFDDLLLLTKILFDSSPETQQKRQEQFLHILVDEAQDTNTIQFELMKQIAWPEATITFIGDDYQSIYRWRGAVMDNFLNLKQRRPSMEVFKLETNYRSKPHIVSAGNAVIQKNQKQYEKELKAHRTGDDMIRIFAFADEVDEAQQIIELITKLKEEHNKYRSDFTILYRTNAQSSPFEQILLTEWIPYSVVWAFKFFERVEIKDMISYLRFLLNPRDSLALQRIINTPNRKIWKTSLEQIEAVAQQEWVSFAEVVTNIDAYAQHLPSAVSSKVKQFQTVVQSLLWLVEMLAPWQLLEQIVSWTWYHQYLVKTDWKDKADERMENIWQLINIAYKYNEVWAWALAEFIEEVSLMSSFEDKSAWEHNDVIRLMSVHASKWLEFPYVFLVWVEEWVFPLPKAKFDDAELEEERRWMYVAITRAKDHLFLSYALSRQQRWQVKYNPPSRFIEEIPDAIKKTYDMQKPSTRTQASTFELGERVTHKLFGSWEIMEHWWNVVIVRFDNNKFGVRKMEPKRLQAE
jgi:DNA helicase II / ATP-dependent DNA helicase PcrA